MFDGLLLILAFFAGILGTFIGGTQTFISVSYTHLEGILDNAYELQNQLQAQGIRVKVDASDKSPGWKFSEAEMRGIPLRLEIGPRDLQNGQCVVAKRVNGEKLTLALDETLPEKLATLLDEVHDEMYQKALKFRDEHITDVETYEEFKEVLDSKGGYVKMAWCCLLYTSRCV